MKRRVFSRIVRWHLLAALAVLTGGTVLQCYDLGFYDPYAGIGWYGAGPIDQDVFDYYNDQWDAYILE
jgi:hypothetical protein